MTSGFRRISRHNGADRAGRRGRRKCAFGTIQGTEFRLDRYFGRLGAGRVVRCDGFSCSGRCRYLNPAVTLAFYAAGSFPAAEVVPYIAAQLLGAFVGAVLVYLAYLPHWKPTTDKALKLGVFCTAPAIRNIPANCVTEVIGTFVLVFVVIAIGAKAVGADGVLGPLMVGLLVWALGVSLGGPTGYAINPARDLGPRIAHALLPIPGKGGSDWSYAWVPVAAPIIGGLLAIGAASAVGMM